MNINYKQSQFELFPGAGISSDRTDKPQFLFASLTLSIENIVISTIFILMAIVFSFSAGVEKGKKITITTPGKVIPYETTTMVNAKPSQKPLVTTNAAKTVIPNTVNEDVTKEKSLDAPLKQEILDSPFTIQVASFAKDEYAQKEAMALKKKGYEISVILKGKYSIVCVGKFSRKDEATVILSRLKKTYKDCMIRRL